MKQIVVIGGGPAGCMAAGMAARAGHRVTLIEKNAKIGRKLAITGKGRCNLTNACPAEELIGAVVSNPRFLYSAFYTFSSDDTVAFFEGLGVETKVERGGRVFPASDKAYDVVDALLRFLRQTGVELVLQQTVTEILTENGAVSGVVTDEKTYPCDGVIVATGGASYPVTGSTGDGYRFARALGHTVLPPGPSLVPVNSSTPWVKDVMGLALKNVGITVYEGTKKIYSDFGELLFAHFGLTGPVILSASAHMRKAGPYRILLDLKPALDNSTLAKRLERDFLKYARKQFQNSLDDLLPKRLIPVIVAASGIDPHKQACQITRQERDALVQALKQLPVEVTGLRSLSEAIVTYGGIQTGEINPSTMESKLVHGLYFAGEVIDCDAYTGGFNLQIAFSTGYLAGKSIE